MNDDQLNEAINLHATMVINKIISYIGQLAQNIKIKSAGNNKIPVII
jgi:hypothetical protein